MRGALTEYVVTRRLWALAIGTGLMLLVWILTDWILQESFEILILAGLSFTVVAIALVVLHNWRAGFHLFLAWLLFEDLARKYLGNNMVIYFGKDVLAGAIYLSLLMAFRRGAVPRFRPPFWVPFMFFLWLGILQVLNPASPSLLYGLLGLKLYFYYVPLMFVGYSLVNTEKDLHRFLVVNVGLAGVIALLGIIQAIVGPTFLNPPTLAPELRLLGTLTRTAPLSGEVVYRPTSVFVSDGRFAWYLILAWLLGFGGACYLILRGRRGRLTIYSGIALVTGGLLLTGSRGAIMWTTGSALVLTAAFLWGAPWRWRQRSRMVQGLQRAFTLGGIGVVVLIFFFPAAVGARWAFYSETLSPYSVRSELGSRAWDYPVKNFLDAFERDRWPYGYGIGTASLGGQYVTKLLSEKPQEIGVESGFGVLIIELGILGLVFWAIWVMALLISGWRAVSQLRETPYFPVGFSILWFTFLVLVAFTYAGMQAYQNFVFNAYLWLLVGIMFRLPTLTPKHGPVPAGFVSSRDGI